MKHAIALLFFTASTAHANFVKVNTSSGILVCPNVALTSGSAVPVDVPRVVVTGEGDSARVLDRYEHIVRFGATAETEAFARKIIGDKPKGEIASGLVLLVLEKNLPFDASKVGLSTDTSPGAHPLVGKRAVAATIASGALLNSKWLAGAGEEGSPLGRMTGQIFEIVAVLTGRGPTGTVFAPVALHQQSWIGPTMKEWCGHPPGVAWLRKFQRSIHDKMVFLKGKKTERANDAVRCLNKYPDQAYSLTRRMERSPNPADYDRLFEMTGAVGECVARSGEQIPANLHYDYAPDTSGETGTSTH